MVSRELQPYCRGVGALTVRELQKDGEAEEEPLLDQRYEVQHWQTDFDYVVVDSDVEHLFAELLDSHEDIKLFSKLPVKLKIDKSVVPYSSDRAITKQEDAEDRTYMIRETKSSLKDLKLCLTERDKIKATERLVEAIGIDDYARAFPRNRSL